MAPSPTGAASCIARPRVLSSRAVSNSVKAPDSAECRVLTRRVAGDKPGMFGELKATGLLKHAKHCERCRHHGRLGVLGQRQLALRPLPHEPRQPLVQRVINLLEDFARRRERLGKGLAHADGLAALTGKDEGFHMAPLN